jgi:hypothetical protein
MMNPKIKSVVAENVGRSLRKASNNTRSLFEFAYVTLEDPRFDLIAGKTPCTAGTLEHRIVLLSCLFRN